MSDAMLDRYPAAAPTATSHGDLPHRMRAEQADLSTDLLVMSTTAVTDGVCYIQSQNTVITRPALIASAARTVALVDHTKSAKRAPHRLVELSTLHRVLVDSATPSPVVSGRRARGAQLDIVARSSRDRVWNSGSEGGLELPLNCMFSTTLDHRCSILRSWGHRLSTARRCAPERGREAASMTPDAVAVCVDAGTGAIKAVLFDADGRELAVTCGDTAVAHPTRERSEQDMGEVWDAVVATVREGVPSSTPRWAVRGCLATVRGGSAGPTDAAAPTDLRLCGGGTASPLWCQLIADVTGAEAVCTEDTQTGANGALLTALAALGDHADVSAAAAALVPERHRFVPDKTVQDLHDAEHAEFLATRALVAQRWVHWRAADPGALHG